MKKEKEILLEKLKKDHPYLDVSMIASGTPKEIERIKKLIPEISDLLKILDAEAKERKDRYLKNLYRRNNF